MHLPRHNDVLEHAPAQGHAVDLHNLVAVAQVALGGDGAPGLHLDNNIIEGQPDAETVLLSEEVDSQLVHLLRRPLRLFARAEAEHAEDRLLLLRRSSILKGGEATHGRRRLREARLGGHLGGGGRGEGGLVVLVHGVVLRLHLHVELLVVVIERVLVEGHACGGVVVVYAALGVEALLPSLRLGCLESLIRNPQEVGVLLDVHAQVLGVLEHIAHCALEIVLCPHIFTRWLLTRLPADVRHDRHVHHRRVVGRAVRHVLLECLQLLGKVLLRPLRQPHILDRLASLERQLTE